MSDMILKARYVLSAHDKVVENGVVIVANDKISTITSFEALTSDQKLAVIDLGIAVIVPGLVNAHTHLELTDLHGIKPPDNRLISWIEELIRAKIKWKKPDFVSSLEKGIKLSLESGTTTVADITNSGHSIEVLQNSQIRKIAFVEVINFDPSKAVTTIKTVTDNFNGLMQNDLFRYGISPHAPYTVSSELYKESARITGLPLCTHIAETMEEVTFLTEGKGPFVDFLNRFRMLPNDWKPPELSPVKYLATTGILETTPLLIHCNYISDDEISLINEMDISVVYCPRSHRFFRHKNHPVVTLLEKGVNVAIGTDSLASNDSLSVLDEMKFVYNNFPEITPKSILAMGTENGARALGLRGKSGNIEPGSYADISVVRLPSIELPFSKSIDIYNDICRRVFNKESENIFTMVNGIVSFDKYNLVNEKKNVKNT